MKNYIKHLLGNREAVVGAIIGGWDKLSDQTKVDIANAAVEKLKDWGIGEKKDDA